MRIYFDNILINDDYIAKIIKNGKVYEGSFKTVSIGGDSSGLTYVGNNPLSKWRQTGIGRVQWL